MGLISLLVQDRRGVSTIEYAVLAFAIVAVVGGTMLLFGTATNDTVAGLEVDIQAAVARARSGLQ